MDARNEPKLLQAGQGRSVAILGDLYTFKVSGEQTGGTFALTELTIDPGNGTPPHVHRREDETFYILEGRMTFVIAGRETKAGAGDTVFAPRDVPHYFQNREAEPARLLCLNSPAGLERFFLEIGEPLPHATSRPAPVSPESIQKVLDTAPRYGIEILAPGGACP